MALPEIQCRIALSIIPGIGPIKARRLVENYGSAAKLFTDRSRVLNLKGKSGAILLRHIRSSEVLDQARKEMNYAASRGIRILCFDHKDFPSLLLSCPDAPFILYVRGDISLNNAHSLSVVGTRRASSYGRDMCQKIIGELGAALPALLVVSGLAYGIDIMAHRAALDMGLPTIAVLAHGFEYLYPAKHRETAEHISRHGALITDFISSTKPERNNFLRRNRIIAGFSPATLVVESARTGGALVTARQALEYNRDVLAVPGRTSDVVSQGCNRLIASNRAALTESGGDVLYHLNWNGPGEGNIEKEKALTLMPNEKILLRCLGYSPGLHPDELSGLTGLPMNLLLELLLELELKDWIHMDPGMRYSMNPCYLTLLKDIDKR